MSVMPDTCLASIRPLWERVQREARTFDGGWKAYPRSESEEGMDSDGHGREFGYEPGPHFRHRARKEGSWADYAPDHRSWFRDFDVSNTKRPMRLVIGYQIRCLQPQFQPALPDCPSAPPFAGSCCVSFASRDST